MKDEQWQWVLGQCGFTSFPGTEQRYVSYPSRSSRRRTRDVLEYVDVTKWIYPNKQVLSHLPPPDLNNLFKYAVPKIREKGILFLVNVLIEWLMDYIYRDKDPASALLGACFKAFGGKE